MQTFDTFVIMKSDNVSDGLSNVLLLVFFARWVNIIELVPTEEQIHNLKIFSCFVIKEGSNSNYVNSDVKACYTTE